MFHNTFYFKKMDAREAERAAKKRRTDISPRDARIISFLNQHDLPLNAIIVLQTPDASYYLLLNPAESGVKTKDKFEPTPLYEENVFAFMKKDGWEKNKLSYPPKIIYTIKKENPVLTIAARDTHTKGNTYQLPHDLEKFIKNCDSFCVNRRFFAYNSILIQVLYQPGINQQEIETTYGLKQGHLTLPFREIIAKHGDDKFKNVFSLHSPLQENEINLICRILRDGWFCVLTRSNLTVTFSGKFDIQHYYERYQIQPWFPVE